ncbi:unnamed protein product [Schistosoma mattheei]|uniref:Uncharacterized protein n=1 Tax=Schistosoma mattheei TaxID=31246 RepID=A0A183PZE7_9TREM|nr:unnamed protein product [Schistosoma mattheei]
MECSSSSLSKARLTNSPVFSRSRYTIDKEYNGVSKNSAVDRAHFPLRLI